MTDLKPYLPKSKVEDLRGHSDDSDDKKPGKWHDFISYFAETTSFMGIPKIWASQRIFFKVMWTLFFLTTFVVMIIQLVNLFRTFYSFPVKTSVKLGFKPLPFPSITVCNMNPIKRSQAHNLDCSLQKALQLEDEHQSDDCLVSNISVDFSEYSEFELVCEEDEFGDEVCYEQEATGLDQYYVRLERIKELLEGENRQLRKEVGHQLEHMLVKCNINGRTCSSDNFTHFLSPDLGNCYTMDGGKVRVKKSGPESGLEMVLNIESEEFIRTYKTGLGLRVVLHDKGTRPFPSSEGFTVSGAAETSIGMKLIYINRLGGNYGKCNNSKAFREAFGIQYTEKACREFCQKNIIIGACKCQPDTYDVAENSSVKVCETEKEWTCEDRTVGKYVLDTGRGIDVCNCYSPCNETVYEASLSSRAWPVIEYVRTLEGQVCQDHGLENPKCAYANASYDDIELRKSSFVKLKIFFRSLNYETIKEEPFYDTERFLSDIGGTMGLWIGASILSLAELIEIFIHLLRIFICGRKK